jgi:hypothetical protein
MTAQSPVFEPRGGSGRCQRRLSMRKAWIEDRLVLTGPFVPGFVVCLRCFPFSRLCFLAPSTRVVAGAPGQVKLSFRMYSNVEKYVARCRL